MALCDCPPTKLGLLRRRRRVCSTIALTMGLSGNVTERNVLMTLCTVESQ